MRTLQHSAFSCLPLPSSRSISMRSQRAWAACLLRTCKSPHTFILTITDLHIVLERLIPSSAHMALSGSPAGLSRLVMMLMPLLRHQKLRRMSTRRVQTQTTNRARRRRKLVSREKLLLQSLLRRSQPNSCPLQRSRSLTRMLLQDQSRETRRLLDRLRRKQVTALTRKAMLARRYELARSAEGSG